MTWEDFCNEIERVAGERYGAPTKECPWVDVGYFQLRRDGQVLCWYEHRWEEAMPDVWIAWGEYCKTLKEEGGK